MKVLIDTNIIVDVALERQPFYPESVQVISRVYQQQIEGYLSASTWAVISLCPAEFCGAILIHIMGRSPPFSHLSASRKIPRNQLQKPGFFVKSLPEHKN